MGMVVRTNTMALNANRNLNINNNQVSKSLQKLSSGYKINSAADDASGLAISEKMKAQIAGLDQASANAQDGISLVQTAEGATSQIHSMLNRMVELATKSANGTIQDDVDRDAIQSEVDALNTEITRISQSTNFNGINLLDGSLATKTGATIASDITTSLSYTTTDAVKGKYTQAATAKFADFAAAGDKISYTVALDDGTSSTVELTAKVKDGVHYLEDQDGGTYSVATSTAAAKAGDISKALQAAMSDKIGDKFTVTVGTDALVFEAKNGGTDAAKVVGVTNTVTPIATGTAATTSGVTETTPAKDATMDLSTDAATGAFTMYDATNAKDATFTINDKKFVIAATGTDVSELDSDVTVLVGATAEDALADELNLKLIEAETGIKAEHGTDELNLSNVTVNASGKGLSLQIGDTNDIFNKVAVGIDNLSAEGIGTANIDVSNQTSAGTSVATIKNAINKVSTNRANLGALQNRLEYTIENLDNTSENITSANSAIRDTDMAKEMMSYSQNNILLQAAQSMLAQANSAPQAVLQLLQ